MCVRGKADHRMLGGTTGLRGLTGKFPAGMCVKQPTGQLRNQTSPESMAEPGGQEGMGRWGAGDAHQALREWVLP